MLRKYVCVSTGVAHDESLPNVPNRGRQYQRAGGYEHRRNGTAFTTTHLQRKSYINQRWVDSVQALTVCDKTYEKNKAFADTAEPVRICSPFCEIAITSLKL